MPLKCPSGVRGVIWVMGMIQSAHGVQLRCGPVSPCTQCQFPIASAAAMAPIRATQQRVANRDRRARWIDVDDLPNVRQHHFSSTAQLVIGPRYAEAYLKLR